MPPNLMKLFKKFRSTLPRMNGLAVAKRRLIVIGFYLMDCLAIALLHKRMGKHIVVNKKRLVFVRVDAIGDFIIWMGSFGHLLQIYPKDRYEWILVCNAPCSVLAEACELFDEVIAVDINRFQRNLLYRLSTLQDLARSPFDLVFQPTYSRALLAGDAIVRALCSSEKIGTAGDLSNETELERALGNRAYTQLLPTRAAPLMELQRNAEVLTLLVGRNIVATKPDLRALSKKSSFLSPTESYFVIFPGASWVGKQWPFERFLEISKLLQSQTGWLCVFAGSDLDEKKFRDSIGRVTAIRYLNLQGKTSLIDLVSLISDSRLLLTNDTSASHIGNATGIPTFTMLGGGHFGRFLPWDLGRPSDDAIENSVAMSHEMPCFNCNWECIYGVPPGEAMPCLSTISVEVVWTAICDHLKPFRIDGISSIKGGKD
jgi:ADP-heptose:LPS heptosyltransferase